MRKRLRKKLAKPWLEIAERYASAPASFWITAPMRAHDMFFEAMILKYFAEGDTPVWIDDEVNLVALDEVADD